MVSSSCLLVDARSIGLDDGPLLLHGLAGLLVPAILALWHYVFSPSKIELLSVMPACPRESEFLMV